MDSDPPRLKYPPPNLPPQYECEQAKNGPYDSTYNVAGYQPPLRFWRIFLEGDLDGDNAAWIDCADKPEYWVREHVAPRAIANSYEEAKAHIEALAWLGEL